MVNITQTIFSDAFLFIEDESYFIQNSLNFVPKDLIEISQHRFTRWPGAEQVHSHCWIVGQVCLIS